MFIAILFITARNLKQPRCISNDGQLMKICYIYTKEYYSAVRKTEIMKFAGKWIKNHPN